MQYWTRRHLLEMTRAYVIHIPTAATATATATTPILPNLKPKIVITQSIFELGP